MSKNERPTGENLKDDIDEVKSLDEYDKKLEEMEMQIKELKKIKRRKKKMMELELEKEEILRKMDKSLKNKHK